MNDDDDPINVLLLGGTSQIGLAILRALAARQPVTPSLLGRDPDRLSAALTQLQNSGCRVGHTMILDARDTATHERAIGDAFEQAGRIDLAILAIGLLGGQAGLDDIDDALEVMRVNFTGCGSLMLHTLRRLRAQHAGTLIVLSSVAAERPRATNAIYGATKAGLDALAQGLADQCAGSGVRVLVVRPGFVRTRMTANLKPAPFATSPEIVAAATLDALSTHAHTVWVPGALRPIFTILRHLPRPLYRRLPL